MKQARDTVTWNILTQVFDPGNDNERRQIWWNILIVGDACAQVPAHTSNSHFCHCRMGFVLNAFLSNWTFHYNIWALKQHSTTSACEKHGSKWNSHSYFQVVIYVLWETTVSTFAWITVIRTSVSVTLDTSWTQTSQLVHVRTLIYIFL